MKRYACFVCMVTLLMTSCAHNSKVNRSQIDSDSFSSKILKIYSAEDNGAQYRAYLVLWNGKEVIAEDPLGQTEYQIGENVTVLAIRVKVNDHVMGDIQSLSFLLRDFKQKK